jgi:hypothetical protein
MSIPAAIYRKAHLYSVIPELEQIDIQIGVYPRISKDISDIRAQFQMELSNVTANGGDLSEFYTSFTSMMYLSSLENAIINSNTVSEMDLSNVFQQKITLLEAAYSNIAPPPQAP